MAINYNLIHTYKFLKDRLTKDELISIKKGDIPGYLKDKIDEISIVVDESGEYIKVDPQYIIDLVQSTSSEVETKLIFKRSVGTPDTPTGNDPTGPDYGDWQDSAYPSDGTGDALYMSTGKFIDAELEGTWSEPAKIDGEDGLSTIRIYKKTTTFSAPTTPTTTDPTDEEGWYLDYSDIINWDTTGNYIWVSLAVVEGFDGTTWSSTLGDWSDPILEKVIGQSKISYIFKRAESRPNTPTALDPVPETWNYGDWKYAPYAKTDTEHKLWMSQAVIFGDTLEETWTEPIALDEPGSGYYKKIIFKSSETPLDETDRPEEKVSPVGWYDTPEEAVTAGGDHIVYASLAIIKVLADGVELLMGEWSIPYKWSGEDGKDGKDGEDGEDGEDGTSTALARVFRRMPFKPDKPIDDEFVYNWDANQTEDGTVSGDWSTTIPPIENRPDILYECTANLSQSGIGAGITNLLETDWSEPQELSQGGVDGQGAFEVKFEPAQHIYVGNVGQPARKTIHLLQSGYPEEGHEVDFVFENLDNAGAVIETTTRTLNVSTVDHQHLDYWLGGFSRPFNTISAELTHLDYLPKGYAIVFSKSDGDFNVTTQNASRNTGIRIGDYSGFRDGQLDSYKSGYADIRVIGDGVELTCPDTSTTYPVDEYTYKVISLSLYKTPPSNNLDYDTAIVDNKFQIQPTSFTGAHAGVIAEVTYKVGGELYTKDAILRYQKQYAPPAEKGSPGNKLESIYRRSTTKPDAPDGNSPTGWSDLSNIEDYQSDTRIWMSQAYRDSSGIVITDWSDPVAIDGPKGISIEQRYKEGSSQPDTPTGNNPRGWSTVPPTDPTNSIWVSIGYFDHNNDLINVWSEPTVWSDRASLDFSELLSAMEDDIAALQNIIQDHENRITALET